MAFMTVNGYDVEHASSLLVYQDLYPQIQHINGMGVIDKYTKTQDVESITLIDVLRVLPYAPRFRQQGATNNGGWHNKKNEGGFNNAPQSVHFTIPVDLWYDEGVQISEMQIYSNPIALKEVVMKDLIESMGLSINIVTFAKQIIAFFKDNFADINNPTQAELNKCVYAYDPTLAANVAGSAPDAFIKANMNLTTAGCPKIGALRVPLKERQAFVSGDFDSLMLRQYEQNASDAAAKILANGFINPFNGTAITKIDDATGLCGMYAGVGCFLMNDTTKAYTYLAMGVNPSLEENAATIALLDKIGAMIVYGAGTCRGIVGPTIDANKNFMYGGVYILPKLKMGVQVLSGTSIKMVVNGGFTTANITTIANALTFTPIDGEVVTGNDILGTGVFNTGLTN
jgi:hypothetical protein